VPPRWLTVIAWFGLAVAAAACLAILYDIVVRGHRQRMRIMDVVWPVTALYLGPLAWWWYRRWGRPNSPAFQRTTGARPAYGRRASVAIGVSHCGAGCTLGDIVAEWAVFALGLQIAGTALLAEYTGDFVLALALGIVFQYFAIAPMRGLGSRKGIVQAAKADVLSLTAFEVGLFGWMALMSLVFFPSPHLHPDSPVYWFGMQIGMVVGFFTAWPVNVWLIRKGIKEAM
jgi:Domain of unknown function (DUF4396)